MLALDVVARSVLDENRYVTLGTADAAGRPWVSPLFYTLGGYAELLWISEPRARHSRNIAVRPQVSLVVYDSRVPVGAAKAVYMSGVAAEVTGTGIAAAAAAYNERSLAKGGQEIGVHEVRPTGRFRVYRATVTDHWVLDPLRRPAGRLPVTP
jgi:nitroimidazol reductase NimA-like FMN-containing flavoprotein (pyridoxamine 5'-phosphate oxidase superfamily)